MTALRTAALRRRTTGLSAAALVGTALVVLPAVPAHAATTVTFTGGVLTVAATSAEDVYVTDDTSYDTGQPVTSIGFDAPTTVPGCTDAFDSGYTWHCSGVTKLVFHGSPSADSWLALGVQAIPQELHGGDGNDDLTAGDGDDRIFGDGGDDDISAYGGEDELHGGDGDEYFLLGGDGDDVVNGDAGEDRPLGGADDDVLSGGPDDDEVLGDSIYYDDDPVDTDGSGRDGDDTLRGDAGDDVLRPSFGSDVVHGGTGVDTISYEGMQEDGVDFAVTLDRVANDGIVGDEADNVDPSGDVENIQGPEWATASTTLRGDDGPNEITEGSLAEALEVDGGGGSDLVYAGSYEDRAAILLLGGDGDDSIEGFGDVVAVDAGSGADTIDTGSGNDLVTAGPGADTVETSGGNDQLHMLDGAQDQVGCGIGGDIAVVDHVDVVNADPGSLCETVNVPRPETTVTLAKTVNLDAKGRASLPLENASGFAVTAELVARSTKGKAVTVAKGKGGAPAEGAGQVSMRLTKAGKKLARKAKKLPAKVTVSVTGNGQSQKTTRKVVLK